ncbi:hypothetical protein EXIGLDRAFT_489113 [Exidia glandulosa HHB12029]|uniref:Uncharacterized protein n=1 Tax=Exidia glandulosa HHB12029 TaxID=1314781 RepID=A0A166NDM6_EXIGL|nr:hypothetical protein EXIGLDRAFT_489113 [Exidia glandulosa HHB12029]
MALGSAPNSGNREKPRYSRSLSLSTLVVMLVYISPHPLPKSFQNRLLGLPSLALRLIHAHASKLVYYNCHRAAVHISEAASP